MDFAASGISAGGHYVQTRPAICDFNHGLNRARAVTIHGLVVPRRDKDLPRLTLQGMKT
jgi:hypothetical protein